VAEPIQVDAETHQAWVQVSHGARLMSHILAGVPRPAKPSAFGLVDAMYPFERASIWHRSYLGAGLEHLLLWADVVAPLSVQPGQVVEHSLRPAYTLGRAALESASQAVWMTAADSPRESVRRHLSLIRWDYKEHGKSAGDEVAKLRVQEMDARLIGRVSGEFSERELRPPTFFEVLRAAAPAAGADPDDVERVWRAASGAAHGKHWPSLELQHVVPLHEYEPGQFQVLFIPDPAGMTEVLRLADQMITCGVLRHAQFCGADVEALRAEARRWLVSKVPLREDADPEVIAHLKR